MENKSFCIDLIKNYTKCLKSKTPYRCNELLYFLNRFECFEFIIK